MVDIHHQGTCEAPVHVAFAYVNDYRTTTSWMFGLSRFVPAGGAKDHGLGAVFDATFAVKPIRLNSTVEIIEWEQDRLIAFTSIRGFTNSSTWRFEPDGEDRTKIIVRFGYELPGGLAGRALGRALEPIVSLSVRHSDDSLRKNIETRHTG